MKNKSLYILKAKYFTKRFANINNTFENYDKWDFSFDEIDLKSDTLISKKKLSYNKYNNFNFINIFFYVNGNPRLSNVSIKCKLNELTENIIQRFLAKYGGSNFEHFLFIHNNQRLDLNISLGDNDVKNNSIIIVIHIDSDWTKI